MHKFTSLALLTVIGALATPAFAAPNTSSPGTRPDRIDCSLPANAKNPLCLPQPGKGKPGQHPGGSSNSNGSGNTPPAPPSNDNKGPGKGPGNAPGGAAPAHNQPSPPNNGGNPPPPNGGAGPGNWSRQDSDAFHQRFRSFNFGTFPIPSFGVHLGVAVPHSFALRPVPASIYRYYPKFRGYLYFETRHGDVVIVSPKSHRIVAII